MTQIVEFGIINQGDFMNKILFGLFCLTAFLIGCANLPARSDLTPVSEEELATLLHSDNAKIATLYNSMESKQTSACMHDKSAFGVTEICKSFEMNVIYIKRNNQVIFQSPIFVQEEVTQIKQSMDLSI